MSRVTPLPPENIASTLGAILLAASKDKAKDSEDKAGSRSLDDFAVCPYVATAQASGS